MRFTAWYATWFTLIKYVQTANFSKLSNREKSTIAGLVHQYLKDEYVEFKEVNSWYRLTECNPCSTLTLAPTCTACNYRPALAMWSASGKPDRTSCCALCVSLYSRVHDLKGFKLMPTSELHRILELLKPFVRTGLQQCFVESHNMLTAALL